MIIMENRYYYQQELPTAPYIVGSDENLGASVSTENRLFDDLDFPVSAMSSIDEEDLEPTIGTPMECYEGLLSSQFTYSQPTNILLQPETTSSRHVGPNDFIYQMSNDYYPLGGNEDVGATEFQCDNESENGDTTHSTSDRCSVEVNPSGGICNEVEFRSEIVYASKQSSYMRNQPQSSENRNLFSQYDHTERDLLSGQFGSFIKRYGESQKKSITSSTAPSKLVQKYEERAKCRKACKCMECGKYFTSDNLAKHKLLIHPFKRQPFLSVVPIKNRKEPQIAKQGEFKSLTCSQCHKNLSSENALRDHQIVVHRMKLPNYRHVLAQRQKKEQCNLCNQTLHNVSLRCHVRVFHKGKLARTRTACKPNASRGMTRRSSRKKIVLVQTEVANIEMIKSKTRKKIVLVQTEGSNNNTIRSSPRKKPMLVQAEVPNNDMIRASPRKKSVLVQAEVPNPRNNKSNVQKCDICKKILKGSLDLHKFIAHKIGNHQELLTNNISVPPQYMLRNKLIPKENLSLSKDKCPVKGRDVKNQNAAQTVQVPLTRRQSNTTYLNISSKAEISTVSGESYELRSGVKSKDPTDLEIKNKSKRSSKLTPSSSLTFGNNPDLEKKHSDWIKRRLRKTSLTIELYKKLLTRRCRVSLVDLKYLVPNFEQSEKASDRTKNSDDVSAISDISTTKINDVLTIPDSSATKNSDISAVPDISTTTTSVIPLVPSLKPKPTACTGPCLSETPVTVPTDFSSVDNEVTIPLVANSAKGTNKSDYQVEPEETINRSSDSFPAKEVATTHPNIFEKENQIAEIMSPESIAANVSMVPGSNSDLNMNVAINNDSIPASDSLVENVTAIPVPVNETSPIDSSPLESFVLNSITITNTELSNSIPIPSPSEIPDYSPNDNSLIKSDNDYNLAEEILDSLLDMLDEPMDIAPSDSNSEPTTTSTSLPILPAEGRIDSMIDFNSDTNITLAPHKETLGTSSDYPNYDPSEFINNNEEDPDSQLPESSLLPETLQTSSIFNTPDYSPPDNMEISTGCDYVSSEANWRTPPYCASQVEKLTSTDSSINEITSGLVDSGPPVLTIESVPPDHSPLHNNDAPPPHLTREILSPSTNTTPIYSTIFLPPCLTSDESNISPPSPTLVETSNSDSPNHPSVTLKATTSQATNSSHDILFTTPNIASESKYISSPLLYSNSEVTLLMNGYQNTMLPEITSDFHSVESSPAEVPSSNSNSSENVPYVVDPASTMTDLNFDTTSPSSPAAPDEKEQNQCPEVNPKNCYPKLKELKIILQDAGQMPKECPICSDMIPIIYLDSHKAQHEVDCHICGKQVLINEVVQHGITHVASLTCEVCQNFTARTRLFLWEHMNTHFGVKPLFCLTCGKAFAQKRALQHHHKTMHVNAWSYKCEYCEFTTTSWSDKKTHEVKHYGDTTTCIYCNTEFTSKRVLYRHMDDHYVKLENGQRVLK